MVHRSNEKMKLKQVFISFFFLNKLLYIKIALHSFILSLHLILITEIPFASLFNQFYPFQQIPLFFCYGIFANRGVQGGGFWGSELFHLP